MLIQPTHHLARTGVAITACLAAAIGASATMLVQTVAFAF